MKILIRTDASVEIGIGHLMRCLTLADQLQGDGAEVAFVCHDLPDEMTDMLDAHGYRNANLSFDDSTNDAQHLDAEATIKAGKQLFPDGIDWLVVDHYELDIKWESLLRLHARRLLVIDDLANRPHDCDLLFDQNYYLDQDQRYQGLVPENCVTLLGPTYVLLRPEFIEARESLKDRNGTVQSILVFFGGSDPTNQTLKVVNVFKQLGRQDIKVSVVVGSTNPNRNVIQELCEELPNMTFYCQVSNMADLILNADLGIGAGGAAMWERCYLGLPTITVVFADNQERTTEDVAEIGAIDYLGWSDQLSIEDYSRAINRMTGDSLRVRQISNAALKVVQTGATDLASTMQSLIMESGTCNRPNMEP